MVFVDRIADKRLECEARLMGRDQEGKASSPGSTNTGNAMNELRWANDEAEETTIA